MSKRIDLTGKNFGKLTVIKEVPKPENLTKKAIYWLCKCECGNEKIMPSSSLLSGKGLQCWECGHKASGNKKRKDMTGQRFGKLTVVEMIYPDLKKNEKDTRCRCICDCGNEVIYKQRELCRARERNSYCHCGCGHSDACMIAFSEDLTGQKFGRLSVVKTYKQNENNSTKGRVVCDCICDCGNIVTVHKCHLLDGHTKSCGCYHKDRTIESHTIDYTGIVSDYGVKILEKSNNRKWKCECPLCHTYFYAIPSNVINGNSTSCGCRHQSKGEEYIEKFLISYDIKFDKQYTFNDCVSDSGTKLRYDFVIFDRDNNIKSIIEYDGQQHYYPVEHWGGEESLINNQIRDGIKNEYCKSHNIPLLRLPYYLSKEEMKNEIKKVI